MKKILCTMLLMCMIMSGAACDSPQDNSQNSTVFYYQRDTYAFHGADGVIAQETRSFHDPDDLSIIIDKYLLGPEDPNLRLLFPKNTVLKECVEREDTLFITLSKECTNMTAVDLVLSCACLAKTVFPLTSAAKISITTEDGFKHVADPLTFTAESILTEDLIQQLESS